MTFKFNSSDIVCEKEHFLDAFEYLKQANWGIMTINKSVKKIVLWIIELADEFEIETDDFYLMEKLFYELISSWDFDHYSLAKKVESILSSTSDKENSVWLERIENINEENIVPFYQKIVSNNWDNEKVVKYEALMRFYDWDKYHAPWDFLHLLDDSITQKKVTFIMIKKVTAEMWNSNHDFSINITEHDVLNKDLVKYILSQLELNNVSPNRLTIEILENVRYCDDSVIRKINKLKKAWIKIAIDDFWTWYSTFERVSMIQPDFLKIDWTLVNWGNDVTDSSILQYITEFSHWKWIEVIAEVVETQEKQSELERLWIDYSQWYLFSKPTQYII